MINSYHDDLEVFSKLMNKQNDDTQPIPVYQNSNNVKLDMGDLTDNELEF